MLGWTHRTGFADLVREMVARDLEDLRTALSGKAR